MTPLRARIKAPVRRIASSIRRRAATLVGSSLEFPAFGPAGPLSTFHDTRRAVAAAFLRGSGIEIGALHQPLMVPADVNVTYVDRMTTAALRGHYPELADVALVDVDVVDDGERLTTFGDATQDFVVANHFIEHCQNPLQTFHNLFRVLKPAGIMFMAVPDKRFTFDVDRPSTPVDHIMRDFTDGPECSKRQHFEEWSRLVNKAAEADVAAQVDHLMAIDWSIHFHVWSGPDLVELMLAVQRMLAFELELFLRNGGESLCVLRKAS